MTHDDFIQFAEEDWLDIMKGEFAFEVELWNWHWFYLILGESIYNETEEST